MTKAICKLLAAKSRLAFIIRTCGKEEMKLVLLLLGKPTKNSFVLYRMYIDLNVREYYSKEHEANSDGNRSRNEQDRCSIEDVG